MKRVGSGVIAGATAVKLRRSSCSRAAAARSSAAAVPRLHRNGLLHVASAAPHAQHRHQGGTRGRGDHQPGLARPRPAEGQHQVAERLRHRGRPRRRGGDHRRRCSAPIPATASWPRNPAARTARRTASTSGSSIRLDGTTNFIHGFPVYAVSIAPGVPRPGAAGGRLRPGAQRPVLRLARAAARSSTTSGCASPSARAWPSALIGTGFPFRKGDDLKRYLQMLELVMQSCAGVRRPGAAALDLLLRRRRLVRRLLRDRPDALGHRRRLADRSPRPAA